MRKRKLFVLLFLFGGAIFLYIGFGITCTPRCDFDWMAPTRVSKLLASNSGVHAPKVIVRAATTTTTGDAASLVTSLTPSADRTSLIVTTSDLMGARFASSRLESLVTSAGGTNSTLREIFDISTLHPPPAASLPPSPAEDGVFRNGLDQEPKTTGRARSERLLCCTLIGRLGNELYQYASVLGIAYKTSRTPVLVAGQHLRNSLQQQPPGDSSESVSDRCRTAVYIVERACCVFDERLVNLDARKDAKIGLYLQSWRYFKDYERQIRQAVTFNAEVTMAANVTVRALRAKSRGTLVGVHVRRGDYLVQKHVKMGYKAASADYLNRAMSYFRNSAKFGRVTFVVSSDDEHWFKKYVSEASDVVILSRQSPPVDMLILASMDHAIITVGTYGWWVGFLNKGTVVYQKDFIAPNTEIGNQFGANGSDYTYPGWTAL